MAIEDFVVQITNEAVLLTIIISLPAVLASLIVGLAIAIFSATTQIQEQTLSFVPKLFMVLIAFGLLANLMMVQLTDYFHFIFEQVTQVS